MAITYTKPVLRKRGTTAQVNVYSGPVGELVVDTTKSTLVVQNGTAGGQPLAKESVKFVAGDNITLSPTNPTLADQTITISAVVPEQESLTETSNGTYGTQSSITLANGGSFNIPVVTVSNGKVSKISSATITLPTISSGGGGSVDLSNYVTISSLNSQLSSYLTTASAASTYATKTELAAIQRKASYFSVYVSPSGSDSNDGLTSSTPVKTFKKAHEILVDATPSSTNKFSTLDGGSITATPFVNLFLAAGTYNVNEGEGFYWEGGPNTFVIPMGAVTITCANGSDGEPVVAWRQQHCTVVIGGQNGSYSDPDGTLKESPANGSITTNGKVYLVDANLDCSRPFTCSYLNTSRSHIRVLNASPEAVSTTGYQSTRRTGRLTVNGTFNLGEQSKLNVQNYSRFYAQYLHLINARCELNIAPYSLANGAVLTEAQALDNCQVGRLSLEQKSCLYADYLKVSTLVDTSWNYAITIDRESFCEISQVFDVTMATVPTSTSSNGIIAVSTGSYLRFVKMNAAIASNISSLQYFIRDTFGGAVICTGGIKMSAANAAKIVNKTNGSDGFYFYGLNTTGTFTADSDTNKVIPGVN